MGVRHRNSSKNSSSSVSGPLMASTAVREETNLADAKLVKVGHASHSAHVELPDGKRYFAKITGHAKDGTVGEVSWTRVARILGITAPDIEVSHTPLSVLAPEIVSSISRGGEGQFKDSREYFDHTQENIDGRGIILSRDWEEACTAKGWELLDTDITVMYAAGQTIEDEYTVLPSEHIDIIMADYLMDNTDRHLNNFLYAGKVHDDDKHAHPLPFDAAYCFDSRESDMMHFRREKENAPAEYVKNEKYNAFMLYPIPALPFEKWYDKHAQGSQDIVKYTVGMYKGNGGNRAMARDIADFQNRLRDNREQVLVAVTETAMKYVRNERWGELDLAESQRLNVESMVGTVRNRLEYLLVIPAKELATQLTWVK